LTNLERRLKKEIYSKYNMSYHNFVEKFIDEKKTFRTIKIKNYNTTVNLSVGYKNKYVLYWASTENYNIKINNATQAYGNFSNYGISKSDKNGNVTFYLKCPQIYKGTKYYRHVHYVVELDKKWNKNNIYTHNITCNINKNKLNNAVIIDDNTFINMSETDFNKWIIKNTNQPNIKFIPIYINLKNKNEKDILLNLLYKYKFVNLYV